MASSSAWDKYSESDINKLNSLADDYKAFISNCKTERECCDFAIREAEKLGYKSIQQARKSKKKLKAGDKIWATSQGKALVLVHVGKQPIETGMNILGAHMDSPRLDLKQNPLFEKDGLCFLDTHYYGGIKKYQWVTIPLALHGVVALTDGSVKDICIGEEDSDPVFCVTDLLPHLGMQQMDKKASDVVEGEDLDILCGNRPLMSESDKKAEKDDADAAEKQADAVKKYTLKLLKDKYGIEEDDFLSAEIEVVPAGRARDLGFDESMVLGYGQDDRVCAYTSLRAQIALCDTKKAPNRTCVCVLVDKEEIGSVGASGMDSMFFENVIAEVMELAGEGDSLKLRRALASSAMLSSDVSAGLDPAYASVFESKNSAYLGRGLVFNKYTGARGKSGSNDARAEFMAAIRRVMKDSDVSFQTAELGRVDAGGGGTIAFIPARYGMDVIDSGVPVLSMHSPWEVTSKADIYEAYRGYMTFLKDIA